MIKSGIRTLNQVIFFKRWRVGLATLVPTCIATIFKAQHCAKNSTILNGEMLAKVLQIKQVPFTNENQICK